MYLEYLPLTNSLYMSEDEPQNLKNCLANMVQCVVNGGSEDDLAVYFRYLRKLQESPSYEDISAKLELVKQEVYELWKMKQSS